MRSLIKTFSSHQFVLLLILLTATFLPLFTPAFAFPPQSPTTGPAVTKLPVWYWPKTAELPPSCMWITGKVEGLEQTPVDIVVAVYITVKDKGVLKYKGFILLDRTFSYEVLVPYGTAVTIRPTVFDGPSSRQLMEQDKNDDLRPLSDVIRNAMESVPATTQPVTQPVVPRK